MAILRSCGSYPSGDGGRGGVREEDEDTDGRHKEGRGNAETRELRGAQMADNRAVGHDEEGFGDESAEGRNGECDDLTVVLSPGALEAAGTCVMCTNLIVHR